MGQMGQMEPTSPPPVRKRAAIWRAVGCLPLVLWFALIVAVAGVSAAERFSVGGFEFAQPPNWQPMRPPNPMRKAQFRIRNRAGKDDGVAMFFHFGPGRGGAAADNINRWFSQFKEPRAALRARVEHVVIDGRPRHLFFARGTFLAAGPGGKRVPLADYGLLAAMLENPGGDVFVRLVAPDPQFLTRLGDAQGPAVFFRHFGILSVVLYIYRKPGAIDCACQPLSRYVKHGD